MRLHPLHQRALLGLLGLLLVLMQQVGLQHGLQHLPNVPGSGTPALLPAGDDASVPAAPTHGGSGDTCLDCLLLATLGLALLPTLPPLARAAAALPRPLGQRGGQGARARLAYHARAPPTVLR